MSEIKTRPIGEQFEDMDVMLEVVECSSDAPFFGCLACYYCGNCWDWKVGGECEAAKRGDEHDVIFKKIEQ